MAFMSCKTKPVDCKPFDTLDIKENCIIYFTLSEGDQGDFERINQNFAISDKLEIQKIKQNWGLYKTDKRMPCGYGYVVFITQNDKLVKEIDINEPCGYAIISDEWYDFDNSFFDIIDTSRIERLNMQQADSIQKVFFKQSNERYGK